MNLYRVPSDLLLLGEHCFLDCSDECYFTDVYDCRQRRGIKSTVLRLKRGCPAAIDEVAVQLRPLLRARWSAHTFVPIPSSDGTNRPISTLLNRLVLSDTRELLEQRKATPAGWRLLPAGRAELLTVNELVADPRPDAVMLVDDVLTTGSHFRAARNALRERWPGMPIVGLFLARTCSRRQQRCYFNEMRPSRHDPFCGSGTALRTLEGLIRKTGT